MASALAIRADASPLTRSTVFESGTDGYNTFRIPAIIRAANGDVLAFAEGRRNSASDTGDIDLVMRRSTDGGVTWGALQVVSNDGINTVGNPAPVLDRNTGNLILVTTHNLGQDTQTEISNGTAAGTRTVWAQRSTNNGVSWTSPTEITSSVKAAGSRWYATGPGHAIQLERGAHSGRLVFGANQSGPANNGALVFYSDDGGATFTQGGNVYSAGSVNPSESSVVELIDGKININSRNRGGATRSRAVAYSNNAGESFYGIGQATALIDPIVQGSIVRASAIDRGDPQNRVLFSNPADPALRKRMTVRSSLDETLSWNAGKVIDRGASAYSDLVSFGAGQAGLLYEQGSYARIQYAGWDADWLDDPTIVHLDFNEQLSGAAPSAADAIRDSRGYGLHATAESAPAYVPGDPRYGTGSALRFTQGNDAVRVADPLNEILDFESGNSFTLEAVFRTSAHGGASANESGPLISKDVGAASASYWLRVQEGRIRFLVSDGSHEPNVSSSVLVNDGQWHHVAAERDVADGLLRIYVDYELVGTTPDATVSTLANANDLLIGAFNSAAAGTKQFSGDIDFVRVTEGALASHEFVAPLALTSNWNINASGSWSTVGNWSAGVPGGLNQVAILGNAISNPTTVSLNTPQTLGTLTFDSAHGYTISSATNVLTLNVTSGASTINVLSGRHVIDAGVLLKDNLVVNVTGTQDSLDVLGQCSAEGQSVSKTGAGTLLMRNLRADALSIAGGAVRMTSNLADHDATGTSSLNGLFIATGAQLALGNNSLALRYTSSASDASNTVRGYLANGQLRGESVAGDLVLGFADNSVFNRTTFDGVAVTSNTILIGLTLHGDTNLDRSVTFDDLLALAQSYGVIAGATWANGDSNYDGAVTFDDLLALAQAYGGSALIEGVNVPGASPNFEADWALARSLVPEPATLGVMIAIATIGGRRIRESISAVQRTIP